MNLNEASQKALEIAEKRGIHERPHEALKHCAGEVTEALVAYLDYVYDKNKKEEFENEIVVPDNNYQASQLVPNDNIVNKAAKKFEKIIDKVIDKIFSFLS
mgnify:CR=1 FL=1